MTPNDALILRAQCAETISRYYYARRDQIPDDVLVRGGGALEIEALHSGSLFVWRDDLLSAALQAATSLPSPVTFTQGLRPSESGVYFFDRSIAFDGCAKPVRAVSWASFGDDRTMFYLYVDTKGTRWSDMGPLGAFACFIIQEGVDLTHGTMMDARQATTNAEFDTKTAPEQVVRFILASWLWMSQRVMRTECAIVGKHARRIADRVNVQQAVNVVVLRRSDRGTGDSTTDSAGRDFSCQWLVRGHWRQQFYPSKSQHRPIWIEPYVKGPDDKPFVSPKETVFVVTR